MTTYLDRPDLTQYADFLRYLPAEAAARVFDIMCRIVDRPDKFSSEWLTEKGFIAVPLPEDMHEEEREQFVRTLREQELLPLFAVWTILGEDDYVKTCIVEFSEIDADTLFWVYERQFSQWNYLLVSQSCQLALLQVEMGWHVIAGPKALVERVIGSSIEWAREEFDEHVAYYQDYTEGFLALLAQKLTEARDYYWSINDSILNLPDEGSESM